MFCCTSQYWIKTSQRSVSRELTLARWGCDPMRCEVKQAVPVNHYWNFTDVMDKVRGPASGHLCTVPWVVLRLVKSMAVDETGEPITRVTDLSKRGSE